MRAAPLLSRLASAATAAAPRRALSIDASSMRGRDLDTMFSFTGHEQRTLLAMAGALKKRLRAPGAKPFQPLLGSTLSMIFQKRSTRTRVSAEGGFAQLGGHAIFLGALSLGSARPRFPRPHQGTPQHAPCNTNPPSPPPLFSCPSRLGGHSAGQE
jgi:hypothetical protein